MAVKRLLGILLAMGLAWGLLSDPGMASGLKLGSPELASCSFIPDYSTQEYRPPTAVSPAPELDPDLDQSVADSDRSNPGDSPEQPEQENPENNLNLWQRFWRGLLGG